MIIFTFGKPVMLVPSKEKKGTLEKLTYKRSAVAELSFIPQKGRGAFLLLYHRLLISVLVILIGKQDDVKAL